MTYPVQGYPPAQPGYSPTQPDQQQPQVGFYAPPQGPQYPPAPPQGPPPGYGPPQGYPAPQGYGPPQGYQQPPPGYGPPPAQYQAPMAPPINSTTEDFFNQKSSGYGPSMMKNAQFGEWRIGRVARVVTNADVEQQADPQTKQPKFYKDRSPMLVLKVPVDMAPSQHHTEGRGQLFLQGAMREEYLRAMQESGATPGLPEYGATIAMRKSGQRQTGMGNPANVWQAVYALPGQELVFPQEPQGFAAPTQPAYQPPQQQFAPQGAPVYQQAPGQFPAQPQLPPAPNGQYAQPQQVQQPAAPAQQAPQQPPAQPQQFQAPQGPPVQQAPQQPAQAPQQAPQQPQGPAPVQNAGGDAEHQQLMANLLAQQAAAQGQVPAPAQ